MTQLARLIYVATALIASYSLYVDFYVPVVRNVYKGKAVGLQGSPTTPIKITTDTRAETRKLLFQCADTIIARASADSTSRSHPYQGDLFESFRKRIETFDKDVRLDRSTMSTILLFSEEERVLLKMIAVFYTANGDETQCFDANINQANHFIRVLVGGSKTRYPDVDSPSYPNTPGEYEHVLRDIITRARDGQRTAAMQDRFNAVTEIQMLNDRGRLASNLALQKKENYAPIEYAKPIDFTNWSYGAVIVVGHSLRPEETEAGATLSQMSKHKIHKAVELNNKGKLAPLYIFCGGSVRPQLTTIVEAFHMKKYAVETLGIPSHQILIDATSEHTYSNFMNAVLITREIGMPPSKKMVSFFVPDRYGDEDQYDFTVNRMFKRARTEVYPSLDSYFELAGGKWEKSVEVLLKSGNSSFLSPTLLWKDYTKK